MPEKNEGYELIDSIFREFLLLEDPYIVMYLLAVMVSHRLKGDPYWSFLLAPSSSGKSEFINALAAAKNIHSVSTLSTKALISGARGGAGQETSMLLQIQNGIIIMKDFTSIMSEPRETRSELMGQLREVYDGAYSKHFGTGDNIQWKGKITLLAGATGAIHKFREQNSDLGERFTNYQLILPDAIEASNRNWDNQTSGNKKKMQAKLRKAVAHYLDKEVKIPKEMPVDGPDVRDHVIALSEMVARARTTVPRDWGSHDKDITGKPDIEQPQRLSGQFALLTQALRVITYNQTDKPDLTDFQKEIVVKVALDSIPPQKRMTLQELARYDVLYSSGLAEKLGFPTSPVTRWLQDLNALGLAKRIKDGGPKGDKWQIKPRYRKLLQKYEHIKTLKGELDEETATAEGIPAEPENDPKEAVEEAFEGTPLDDETNKEIENILL